MDVSVDFRLGKMNKSVDERLVPQGQYIDALNVRLGSTELTEVGAVENSMGNTQLSFLEYNNLPLGDARCIGAYEDGMEETIYWFVHDDNNPSSPTGKVDLIVSFEANINVLTYHVVSTEVLNFDWDYLMTAVDKIENLLFFSDDLNPPRVINVTRNYNDESHPTFPLQEQDVGVIVKVPGFEDSTATYDPLPAPFMTMLDLPGQENYMKDRFLSFAYRYRYEDGQYSATSVFTNPAFQPGSFRFDISNFNNASMQNRYNGADITFCTGSQRVVEVDLLYKQTTSNVIYVIERFNKQDLGWANNNYETVQFTNSKIYTTLGSDELLRLYDNVPRIAKASTIQGNRLMYGNYVDGYDVTLTEGGQNIAMNYNTQWVYKQIAGESLALPVTTTGTPYTIDPTNTVNVPDCVIQFDLSGANPTSGPLAAGTTFNFTTTIMHHSTTVNGGNSVNASWQNSSPFSVNWSFTCTTQYADVDAMCASIDFQDKIGSLPGLFQEVFPINYSAFGGTVTDKFNSRIQAPSGTQCEFVNSSITGVCPNPIVPWPYTPTLLYSGTVTNIVANTLEDNTQTFTPPTDPAIGSVVTNTDTGVTATVVSVDSATVLTLSADIFTAAIVPPAPGEAYKIETPAAAAPCVQQGFTYSTIPGGFQLQVIACEYYFDDGLANPDSISIMYEYFYFEAFSSQAGYFSTPNTLSLHSNRDFETGVVYMDDYGRASTVLVSNDNTMFVPPLASVYKNRIKVTLFNLPPYWATKYKFVVKPSQGGYFTVYTFLMYVQEDGSMGDEPSTVWFRLEGDNTNILKVGDELIVKMDTGGPMNTEITTTVLEIKAFSKGEISGGSLPGLYMALKPQGFTTELGPDAVINNGSKSRDSNDTGDCDDGRITDYSLNLISDPSTAYSLPAGSTIRIKIDNWRGGGGGSCDSKSVSYDENFTSTADYPDFYTWAIGDSLASKMTTANASVHEMGISFNPISTTSSTTPGGVSCFNTTCWVRKSGNAQYFCNDGAIPRCWEWTEYYNGHIKTTIEVTRGGALMVFETIPEEVDPNLFYDASDIYSIGPDPATGTGRFHLAQRTFTPPTGPYLLNSLNWNDKDGVFTIGQQDQTGALPLESVIDFANCYTFGNGVESMRILDRAGQKYFNLGERVLAVSNQDFKESDRFAGMTYSGVYSGPANSNNLNEFNLGLVNYKDCEPSFGPIQILHSRETDILCLQEDRISYVLASKNVISDSTGGGAIASVPEVLGTQIARIEEFGISFNPESFATWGPDMFFTDVKRASVLNLRGSSRTSDQLQVISQYGMRSWFRDEFVGAIHTQKLGGYDPYMNEYVLSDNSRSIPFPIPEVPCGQTLTQTAAVNPLTFIVNLTPVPGVITVNYTITAGTININGVWNSVPFTSGNVSTSGSFTFNKLYSTPEEADVNIDIISGPATYTVEFECPPEIPLTVVQFVICTPNYSGQTMHYEYDWTDMPPGPYISPLSSNAATLQIIQPSAYMSNTGTRGVGMFPYDGGNTDITLQSHKLGPDTFNFDPAIHKLRWLSSNTVYPNNPTGATNVLAATTSVVPITNPSAGLYEATIINASLPIGNQYLYLVWDLRRVTSTTLCYCAGTAAEACCECIWPCEPNCWFGPQTPSQSMACTTDTNSGGAAQYSFNGTGLIPVQADVVYDNLNCDPTAYLAAGFYIVDPAQPSGASPKNWIEIGSFGTVINTGTC